MAVDLHDKELLPPSNAQFFTEEHSATIPLNNNNDIKQYINRQNWSCFFGLYDSRSELSSPVESELGSTSTETESSEEEDDYMAELSRQMAHYMFQDDDNFNKQAKIWGLAGSPQSTLRSPLGLSHDSPTGPSREPSPPVTPIIGNFVKMKIDDDTQPKHNSHGESYFTTSVECTSGSNQNFGFHSNQALIDDQIRAVQFYRLKQEQIMKQQQSLYRKNQVNVSQKLQSKQQLRNFNNKGRSVNYNGQKGQWPALQLQLQQQQQHTSNHQPRGSGMRAVFLNGSGSGTGSGGTGVFLPRGVGNSNESRKKSGCSTVLIPARVIQALKLHFDKVDSTSRSNYSGFPLQHDALMEGRSSMYAQQQQPQSRTVWAMNRQEMGLPHEWTY